MGVGLFWYTCSSQTMELLVLGGFYGLVFASRLLLVCKDKAIEESFSFKVLSGTPLVLGSL